MNHWFLFARCTMWIFLLTLPLLISAAAGYGLGDPSKIKEGDLAIDLMGVAFFLQLVGVTLLYTGVIK